MALDLNKLIQEQKGVHQPLKTLIEKTQANALLAHKSFEMSKQFASMRMIASISQEMLRSFELPQNSLQKMIDEATRTAEIYRNIGSVTNQFATMFDSIRASVDISRKIFESYQNSFHSIIEPVIASRAEIAKLVQLQFMVPIDQISKSIESILQAREIWQSDAITNLANRVLREEEFRRAFIERLESEEVAVNAAITSKISKHQILEAVESSIRESKIDEEPKNIQKTLDKLFSSWGKLHPDLRTMVIHLIVGILLVVFFEKEKSPSKVTINQQVRIVQNITNNIFIKAGVTDEDHSQFRIVIKDNLPVFSSNRRDSAKLAVLSAGQVVVAKSKKRNWTLIEWKDSKNQKAVTGWVFTRYLKKI